MSDAEARLDELSKALASGHTRRGVLKIGLGLVGAVVAGVLPGRAGASPDPDGGGASDCAHFCKQFPPTKRDDCIHACKAAPCQRDPTRICPGSDPVTCCPPEFGGPRACCGVEARTTCCNLRAGEVCCPSQARCLSQCSPPRIPDPVQCACVCPPETRECTPGGTCCPAGQECCGDVCCPTGQTCQGGTCAPGVACQPGNVCEAHFVCEQFPPVNGFFCACFGTSDGTCLCARNSSCFNRPLCSSAADCPPGNVCVTNHGCPFPEGICLERCVAGGPSGLAQGFSLSSVSGPTAADIG